MINKTINAAYSSSDSYAQHAGLSILSLFENNTNADNINVYIIDGGIGEENAQHLKDIGDQYNRNIIFLDLDRISSKMNVETNFYRSTYGKLFLSQIKDVDTMLVFDCDTIVTGDLSELLDYDMSNTLVAGVQDTVNPYYIKKAGLSKYDRYINCGGVILLNLSLWREMGIEQKCLDYILKHNGNPPFVDQGTINYVCKEHKKILSPQYNLINPMLALSSKKIKRIFKYETYYEQEEIDNAKANPIVIHYTGEFYNRPWFKNCTHPYANIYLKYLAKSPWAGELMVNELSTNCKIQNWIYKNMPFFVYILMIRFVEFRHNISKRVM